MSQPLAATVIGGYLGAGKTTLINHLLRHANGQRLAILVNEFGALPIDEDLIEAQDDELISIAGGCVCCSFGSDLVAAMQDMRLREPRPDHVIIESSGVAMPGVIAASVGLLEGYTVSGIVVLADSETVREQADDEYLGDTTLRQLQAADVIVQTKNDLLKPQQCSAVADWLREVNSQAVLLRADFGSVANELILGQSLQNTVVKTDATATHADHAFESRVFSAESVDDPRALAVKLAKAAGVVRAKGFVRDAEAELWLIQTVGKRCTAERVDGHYLPQMVCIGLRDKPDWAFIENLF